MNVLWLSNVLFPEACKEINVSVPVVGGWMESGAKALLDADNKIRLAVAALYAGNSLKCIEGQHIRYYLIPSGKGRPEPYFQQIKNAFKPDLVHIHGTEYRHSLAYINACGTENVVVSIQGMVSVYAGYYSGGLSGKNRILSLRDIVRRDSLKSQQKNMALRGKSEIEIIQRVAHVIGRTLWDRAHVWAINPHALYHCCNETLRASFYEKEWSYAACEPYSVFLSQAHYPIKGIHQLIKAVPLIKRHFPEMKVYVAGNNFIHVPFIRKNGFALYIEKLMRTYGVTGNIVFLGTLSEEQMAEQFLKANVFVCPSAIENSPNSVGEAQLTGVPCVASYVGGSMDMVTNGETGFLYRFEETALLAWHVCNLFNSPELCESISKKERAIARQRHHPDENARTLLSIYNAILSE
ncbi:hypothetical protein A8C56_06225 [Niabella ginsenosidivorans]|uniref:Glycosyl transferase family 1 domain-containing protein n=1 Tax=Niabella ginsenosidivorans TaxID=1176587 RepID=A0A1A9I1R2_9BACT|nr:glycosyltransferase family 4 protein [Niabella ginsenosidivorans]ANH80632.1 hypothetical protein A8C56_06225 [Niabella ginsenosidivorans]